MTICGGLRRTAMAAAAGLVMSHAAAAEPIALALDVTGATEPAVELFSELETGSGVVLQDGAEITFLHYGTCEEVVVRGGRLSLTRQQYLVQNGEIVRATRVKCPAAVALATDTRIGGIRLRAGHAAPRMSTMPSFVLTGSGRGKFMGVRIVQDGRTLVEAPLHGPRFDWPDGAAPLPEGKAYVLELIVAGGPKPATFEFDVVDRSVPLTILRVD